MQFSTKDLMVTVLPKAGVSSAELAKICLWHTRICTYPTFCHFRTCLIGGSWCGFCSLQISCAACSIAGTVGCGVFNSCGADRSVCDPTIFCIGGSQDPWVIRDLEDLVTLRTELQDTLKQLAELEKSVPSAIRSKADADALERGLSEVIQQIRKTAKGVK
jgi:hypothetical protein